MPEDFEFEGFELVTGNSGVWFRVVAENDRTLCHSQTYENKQNAEKGIEAVIDAVKNGNVREIDMRTKDPV